MRALQELGYGTLHCRGALQKVSLKALPSKLPASNVLVDRETYEENFLNADGMLPKTEAAIFRDLHPHKEEIMPSRDYVS